MTSKDNALFEIRKHNDFSVLCSDDEEMTPQETSVSSTGISTAASSVAAHTEEGSVAAAGPTGGDDGFETFTTVRRVKRVIQPKSNSVSSTSTAPAASVSTRTLGKAKEVIVPKPENSIELYEFPSTLKTADLRKFLNDFDGHYRLKWINDTSCYVVFDEESFGNFNILYHIIF